MATEATADGYESWLAEKLWELIPTYYRRLDGEASEPDVLRKTVEVIAAQAALLRRSQDRLWEDQFIANCDSWAVPYIGDLVGTRLISPLLARGQRIDVAKTIYYRRRAGTLRVLEELIADITGWEGVVRENFRRLTRAAHGLDPAPTTAARFSGTVPGGVADLRSPVAAESAGGPFGEFAHTPDFRALRGGDGRHNISKLAFHLYRLSSHLYEDVTPRLLEFESHTFYTFDPSGRDVPLFGRRIRASDYDYDAWESAKEWHLPMPIRCRVLGHAEYEFSAEQLEEWRVAGHIDDDDAEKLVVLAGARIVGDSRLETTLAGIDAVSAYEEIRRLAIVADCGKQTLLGSNIPSIAIWHDIGEDVDFLLTVDQIQAAALEDVSRVVPTDLIAIVDAERGRFKYTGIVPTRVFYHQGFSGPVGAGSFARDAIAWAVDDAGESHDLPDVVAQYGGGGEIDLEALTSGTVQLEDSRTYGPVVSPLGAVTDFALVAEDQVRPYVLLTGNLVFEGAPGESEDAWLAFDGIWFGASAEACTLVLKGDFEQVEIRCCTFDPGGVDAAGDDIHPVVIRVDGFVERLVVQSSIVGAITVGALGSIATLEINDSILHSENALACGEAEVHLERVTVLGNLSVHRLWASDTLIRGTAAADDTQNGCFRFSAANAASGDGLPHPYESAFFTDPSAIFVSTTFGQPGYAQLSDAPTTLTTSDDDLDARASIVTGAENDGEMGAFNSLLTPIKERSLLAKVEEFMPFGLIPLFIHET